MIEIQYSGIALLLHVNPHIPHQNNATSYINYYLKRRRFVASYVQPVIQQQLFEKNFYNQNSHYENYGFQKPSCATTKKNRHFLKMNGTQSRALVSP